jgi:hypothetical protein
MPAGPIDIVGDIHGEYQALINLLLNLGYNEHGDHAEDRKLVFVGDYCDRGPDSPKVLMLIERLVRSSKAFAILGNHEINLLRGEMKSGSGWFFELQYAQDELFFGPTSRANSIQKKSILKFLASLPIGLERDDIRIIHAAWIEKEIEKVRDIVLKDFSEAYARWDSEANLLIKKFDIDVEREIQQLPNGLRDFLSPPPFLLAHATCTSIKQMANPIKVLTAGVELPGEVPFFSNGVWRFVERVRWWNEYNDDVPVIVGHYWRKLTSQSQQEKDNLDPDMFYPISGVDWHGKKRNVFCVDYSVGGRFEAVKKNKGQENLGLAALRWPERRLIFDDGRSFATKNFKT